MVGSHLHQALAWRWTIRVLITLAVLWCVWLFMFATVLLQGQWSIVGRGIARLFILVWELILLVVTSFFRIVFRG